MRKFRYGLLFVLIGAVLFSLGGCGGGGSDRPTEGSPTANPYLSAPLYGVTHFDPSQSDSTPYGPPRGTFDVSKAQKEPVYGGPINIMTLASTSDDYMWAIGTDRMAYVATIDGKWTEKARFNLLSSDYVLLPVGVQEELGPVSPDIQKKVGQAVFGEKPFTTSADVNLFLQENYGPNYVRRIANGVYSVVDRENVLYVNCGYDICAFALKSPEDPTEGIEIIHRLEKTVEAIQGPGHDVYLYGLTLTYDGFLIINFGNGVAVIDRNLDPSTAHFVEFEGEETSNSLAIDEKNGIYVVTDKRMHKLIWTGEELSTKEEDGAWTSPYDAPEDATPPIVKLGIGSGSTPTLMGFGSDEDKLVVITDGEKRMKLVAFWRDDIPEDFVQRPGTASRRIADQIEVTCGLDPLPAWIQSEQSVVVKGYGAFVVNSMPPNAETINIKNKLLGVTTMGPIYSPSLGVERFHWNCEEYGGPYCQDHLGSEVS